MRRAALVPVFALFTALAAACGGGSTPPADDASKAAASDTTCAQPAAAPKEGETPACSEGCTWDGTACKQQRGIIVHERPAAPPRPDHPGPKG